MKQQLFALIIILVALFGTLFLVYTATQNSSSVTPLTTLKKDAFIYFYGNTCPHCKELNIWLEENQIAKKVKIDKKEVYQNKANADQLQQAAKICGLDTSSIGVPFVYDNGKCYVGSDEAKDLFKKKSKS
ncbi:hypothetical protein A2459_01315 [Candidatus Roizmanbacteria bacterium RIFOXYC2_FULL_41_10]|nr:MAG: hypothetical protein A2459_01315 [Candidatus Roizmanbacteria bacterium RIFOXYC2_FULL_41_10]